MTLHNKNRCNNRLLPLPVFVLTIISALVTAIVLMAAEANAIAVSTPYIENNILGVAEGKSTMFTITLQNSEESDYQVKVDYSSDSNIASVIDYKEVYTLPAKSLDTKVVFNITAPEKARIGDAYDFKFSVYPLQAQAGNLIPFAAGIGRSFKVVVNRDPDKFYLNYYLTETGRLWGIVLLILVGYIAYGIYKRKKGKGRGSKIF